MDPRKAAARNAVVATPNGVPTQSSRLPAPLRFPSLVLLSLVLSSALYSIASQYIAHDLGSVSRRLSNWWEVFGLIGWRAIELGIGWWSDYDGVDLASLTLLSHLPTLYLLNKFYAIRPTTVLASLAIDTLTTYLPFRLLRPLMPAHKPASTKAPVPNRSILTDLPVRLVTTLLAAAVYGTVLFGSYRSWLPVHLVSYFDGIKDITAAHSAALPLLIATFIPVGYAAHEFLFTPFAGSHLDAKDFAMPAFDPETATFGETLRYNLWGFSGRSRFMIERIITLMVVTGLNTWLHTFVTIEGVENYGALGWSLVWVLASGLSGALFRWVGGDV